MLYWLVIVVLGDAPGVARTSPHATYAACEAARTEVVEALRAAGRSIESVGCQEAPRAMLRRLRPASHELLR